MKTDQDCSVQFHYCSSWYSSTQYGY